MRCGACAKGDPASNVAVGTVAGMGELRVTVASRSVLLAPGTEAIIGRDPTTSIPLDDPRVSRRHVRISHRPSGWVLEDLGSKGGTYADGAPVDELTLDQTMLISLAHPTTGVEVRLELVAPSCAGHRVGEAHLRIGRAPDNDITVHDLLASRHHAEVRRSEGGFVLVDLGSRNGTFQDGRRIVESPLAAGQVVGIGNTDMTFDGETLVSAPRSRSALEAFDITVVSGAGDRLLNAVSFDMSRGELVAVVGPTGSGKTTLMRALTGFQQPTSGDVHIGGRSLYAEFARLRRQIGYVPQDDILHTQLSARAAMRFSARLRFPTDTSDSERSAQVEKVLGELGLIDRADLPIAKLSGGQRKRTSVAIELLTQPELLVLDEPTSGLDPGYERSVMQLLRTIAREDRSVLVVTHSVASLDVCDKVLVLATGGSRAYFGPPAGILRHFGRDSYAEVFGDLEAESFPVQASATRPAERSKAPALAPLPSAPPLDWMTQVSTLVRRQAAVLAADRRNLTFLAAEALIPALLIAALVPAGSFGAGGSSTDGRTLIGALVVSSVVIGAANAIREIVKEVPIYLRERAAGIAASAYIASKAMFLGAVTFMQVATVVYIALVRADGPDHANVIPIPRLELLLDVALAAFAAVALGLLLSALVSSSEKALALIPVVFVVQWLFSGIALDLAERPVLRPIAYATAANWGVAAAASSADLYRIEGTCTDIARTSMPIEPSAPPSCDARWRAGLPNWIISVGALAALSILGLLGAGLAIVRREPLREPDPLWQSASARARRALARLRRESAAA